MKEVKVKIIRDDNKEFIIDNTVWGIPSDGLSGFDGVDNDVSTENMASGDGTIKTGSRIGEKDRTIKARLKNRALNEIQRKVVTSFFNPKHSFKVYLTYMGRTRWCEGEQIGYSCPTDNVYKPLELTWTILSTMPYMMSVDNYGENISALIPLFGFPFRSIVDYGFGVGAYRYAKEVVIENNGDVETFFRCLIIATGDVKNPKLIKDDKYVRFIDTMIDGDVYEIDFVSKPPTVKKNGVNAIGNTDRTSSLTQMAIDVGGGKFGFDADDGSTNMKVEIYRYERYLGI